MEGTTVCLLLAFRPCYGVARAVASLSRAAGRDTRSWMSRRTIVSASRYPVTGIF